MPRDHDPVGDRLRPEPAPAPRPQQRQPDGERRAAAAHQPISAGRANEPASGITARGVDAEPLLDDRAVEAAEVRGGAQVVVGVELAEARELADHLAADLGADHERGAAGAVVGAGVVLLRAAAELRPDQGEHAVGEPARLEVGLEGGDRVGGELEVGVEALGLVVVGVERARAPRSRRSGSAARRRASPPAPRGSSPNHSPSPSGRRRAA